MIRVCHANVRGALYRNLCRALLYSCKECYVPLQQLLVAFSRILWAQQTGHLNVEQASAHKKKSSGRSIWQSSALAMEAWRHGAVTYWVSTRSCWGGRQCPALQQCHSTPATLDAGWKKQVCSQMETATEPHVMGLYTQLVLPKSS